MIATRVLAVSSRLRLVAFRPAATADWLRTVHSSTASLALVTQKLPSLGDSISEGTLNSWTKQVGEKVAADEVIAVIETDKVSVDLRVPVAGVLSKQLANPGDTVAVGADLYVIDTEGKATVAAPTPQPAAAAAAPSAPSPASTQAQNAAHRHRTPLIKFLGKRSLLKQQPHAAHSQAQQQRTPVPQQAPKAVKHSPNAIDFTELPGRAMHGRPPLTQQEIEYIESGGASMWG